MTPGPMLGQIDPGTCLTLVFLGPVSKVKRLFNQSSITSTYLYDK